MDILSGINNLVKTVSADRKAAKWFVFIVVVALVAGWAAVSLYINKPKKQDHSGQCDYLIEQNRQLVNSLLDIRKNLETLVPRDEGGPVSAARVENIFSLSFASYTTTDTIPKTKQQYQQAIYKILNKIDSALIKNRLDSLRKADLQQRKRN